MNIRHDPQTRRHTCAGASWPGKNPEEETATKRETTQAPTKRYATKASDERAKLAEQKPAKQRGWRARRTMTKVTERAPSPPPTPKPRPTRHVGNDAANQPRRVGTSTPNRRNEGGREGARWTNGGRQCGRQPLHRARPKGEGGPRAATADARPGGGAHRGSPNGNDGSRNQPAGPPARTRGTPQKTNARTEEQAGGGGGRERHSRGRSEAERQVTPGATHAAPG